jgi:translation initiation factor SUI1
MKFNDKEEQKIHIKINKRTDRTYISKIEGLPENLNYRLVAKTLAKLCSCCGYIKANDNKKVILLQGNHAEKIKNFLIDNSIVNNANDIVFHGLY